MNILLYIFGCGPTALEMNPEIQGCFDWNPTQEQPSELRIVREGNDLLISRNYVEQYCDAEFTPDLDILGQYKISIRESWVVQSNDCSSCSAPTIRIKDYNGDYLEFWWYIGDSAISFNVIDTDALDD